MNHDTYCRINTLRALVSADFSFRRRPARAKPRNSSKMPIKIANKSVRQCHSENISAHVIGHGMKTTQFFSPSILLSLNLQKNFHVNEKMSGHQPSGKPENRLSAERSPLSEALPNT